MKNLLNLIIFGFIFSVGVNAQTKIGDVTLPNTLKAGETTLLLNGGGIREKFWMDMYIGGLYLKAKSEDADQIIKADEPMAIKMHIVSGLISSEKMRNATNEGFEKSTGGNVAPLKEKIRQFIDVFEEEIKVDDVFDLVYVPEKGVRIDKNKQQKTLITGLEFKKALFGIWLCDQPADEDLKTGMLGKE